MIYYPKHSRYHLRSTNLRSPPSLGDCILNLSDVTEEPSTRTLRLHNQETGKELNGEVNSSFPCSLTAV
jgi:hypothetical protein